VPRQASRIVFAGIEQHCGIRRLSNIVIWRVAREHSCIRRILRVATFHHQRERRGSEKIEERNLCDNRSEQIGPLRDRRSRHEPAIAESLGMLIDPGV
jgi:hypothetical protein